MVARTLFTSHVCTMVSLGVVAWRARLASPSAHGHRRSARGQLPLQLFARQHFQRVHVHQQLCRAPGWRGDGGAVNVCAQRRRARRGRSVRTELERVHIDTLVLVTRRLLRPHLRARGDRRRQCERSCVRRLCDACREPGRARQLRAEELHLALQPLHLGREAALVVAACGARNEGGSAAQLGVDAGGQSVRSCCARWVREEPLCAVDGATNRGGAAGGQRRREGAAAGRGATMKASRTLVVRDVCGAHPRSRAPRRCVHPRRCCTAAAAAAAAVAAAPAAARRGLAAAAAVVRWAPSCARRALRKRCTRQRDAQAELLTRAAALAARDGGPRFSRPAPPKDANHPCALGRRARAAHPGSSFGTAHAPRRRFIHYCLKSAGDPRGDPRFSAEAPNVAPLRGRQTPCWRLRTRSGAPTAAAAAAAAAAWVGHAGELSRKNGRGSDHRLRQLPARPPCRRPLCRSLVGDGAALRLRSSLAAAAELTAQGKTHHHLSTDTSLAPPPAHGSS